mmetsp:Transcript_29730/g.68846  ORF Transcript_29730/g.68846 Transcript_29730/m.68846 type:complete len:1202 (-) Transcript_29730:232-3837(-)
MADQPSSEEETDKGGPLVGELGDVSNGVLPDHWLGTQQQPVGPTVNDPVVKSLQSEPGNRSKGEIRFIQGAVLTLDFFLRLNLPPLTLAECCQYLEIELFPNGQEIFHQGARSLMFFIVYSGSVIVQTNDPGFEAKIVTLGRGEVFGELALLNDTPRSATIVAGPDCQVMTLPKAKYKQLLQRTHVRMMAREHKWIVKLKECCSKDPKIRSQKDVDLIMAAVDCVDFFANLSRATRLQLCKVLVYQSFPADTIVFRQGDEGDNFYAILGGSVGVWVSRQGAHETCVANLEQGKGFGELALLNNAPRMASIKTNEPCHFLMLSRDEYQKQLSHLMKADEKRKMAMIKNIFPGLSSGNTHLQTMNNIIRDVVRFPAGDVVVKEGEPFKRIGFVCEGSLEMTKTVKVTKIACTAETWEPNFNKFETLHLGCVLAGQGFGLMEYYASGGRWQQYMCTLTAREKVAIVFLPLKVWRLQVPKQMASEQFGNAMIQSNALKGHAAKCLASLAEGGLKFQTKLTLPMVMPSAADACTATVGGDDVEIAKAAAEVAKPFLKRKTRKVEPAKDKLPARRASLNALPDRTLPLDSMSHALGRRGSNLMRPPSAYDLLSLSAEDDSDLAISQKRRMSITIAEPEPDLAPRRQLRAAGPGQTRLRSADSSPESPLRVHQPPSPNNTSPLVPSASPTSPGLPFVNFGHMASAKKSLLTPLSAPQRRSSTCTNAKTEPRPGGTEVRAGGRKLGRDRRCSVEVDAGHPLPEVSPKASSLLFHSPITTSVDSLSLSSEIESQPVSSEVSRSSSPRRRANSATSRSKTPVRSPRALGTPRTPRSAVGTPRARSPRAGPSPRSALGGGFNLDLASAASAAGSRQPQLAGLVSSPQGFGAELLSQMPRLTIGGSSALGHIEGTSTSPGAKPIIDPSSYGPHGRWSGVLVNGTDEPLPLQDAPMHSARAELRPGGPRSPRSQTSYATHLALQGAASTASNRDRKLNACSDLQLPSAEGPPDVPSPGHLHRPMGDRGGTGVDLGSPMKLVSKAGHFEELPEQGKRASETSPSVPADYKSPGFLRDTKDLGYVESPRFVPPDEQDAKPRAAPVNDRSEFESPRFVPVAKVYNADPALPPSRPTGRSPSRSATTSPVPSGRSSSRPGSRSVSPGPSRPLWPSSGNNFGPTTGPAPGTASPDVLAAAAAVVAARQNGQRATRLPLL